MIDGNLPKLLASSTGHRESGRKTVKNTGGDLATTRWMSLFLNSKRRQENDGKLYTKTGKGDEEAAKKEHSCERCHAAGL